MSLSKQLLIRSVITFLSLNSKNIFYTLLLCCSVTFSSIVYFLALQNSHLLNFLQQHRLVFFLPHCVCSQAHYYRPLSSEVTLSGRILFPSLMFSFTFMTSIIISYTERTDALTWPLLWYPFLATYKAPQIEDMKNNKLMVFSLSSLPFSAFLISVNGTLILLFLQGNNNTHLGHSILPHLP